MSQTDQILSALKKCLRAKGLTYRDVAAALELSEASVKRLFSEQSFSLKRLEEICRYLDMNLYDLARLTRMHTDEEITVLSIDQEKALAEAHHVPPATRVASTVGENSPRQTVPAWQQDAVTAKIPPAEAAARPRELFRSKRRNTRTRKTGQRRA